MKIYFNNSFLHFVFKDQQIEVSPAYQLATPEDLDQLLNRCKMEGSCDSGFVNIPFDFSIFMKVLKENFQFISAAGGLVQNEKNEILAIKRLGKYDLPKGKLEEGEDIETCAVREVEEECNVKGLTLLNKLCDTYHTYPLKGEWVLKRTHWYEMRCKSSQNLQPQLEEDIEEVFWSDAIQKEIIKTNTYPSILDVLTIHDLAATV